MSRSRMVLLGAAGLLVLFVGITLVALEGQEVVVLRTFEAEGQGYESRIWIADDGVFAWIESADGERPFLQRIRAQPIVEVVRGQQAARYRAVPLATPDAHEHIRRLLAEKYGLADWWIGLLQDTSGSIAIRLEPLSD